MTNSRILVVDDEPQTRRVLRAALVAQGFAVDDAFTGEDALRKLWEEPPDIVLLDLMMPGMGGIEACREIRASSDVPIIIVSARNSQRTERRLSKPARTSTLRSLRDRGTIRLHQGGEAAVRLITAGRPNSGRRGSGLQNA